MLPSTTCADPDDGDQPTGGPTGAGWWLELTDSRPVPPADHSGNHLQPLSPGAAELRERLLAVLDDPAEAASVPPPTTGGMAQEDWDALTETERNVFRGRQLRSLDPRLVARAVRNPAGPFDRSPKTSSR